MGIENCGFLGIESGRVRALTHGGKGATGVGQRVSVAWGGVFLTMLCVGGPGF